MEIGVGSVGGCKDRYKMERVQYIKCSSHIIVSLTYSTVCDAKTNESCERERVRERATFAASCLLWQDDDDDSFANDDDDDVVVIAQA